MLTKQKNGKNSDYSGGGDVLFSTSLGLRHKVQKADIVTKSLDSGREFEDKRQMIMGWQKMAPRTTI